MDEEAVSLSKDEDLKTLGLSIGTILRLKLKFRRSKLNSIVKDGRRLEDRKPRKRSKATTLYIGWYHYNGEKFSQVRSKRGGGSRTLKVDNSQLLKDVLQSMISSYWPNNQKTGFGLVSHMNFTMKNFEHQDVDSEMSVKQYIELTNHCRARVYLYSRKKRLKQLVLNSHADDTDDDDFELNSGVN